ncbi:alpha/beta hydrolase fold protein [Fusarium bulbicola]|nr:alpha/beta hydrolase fold protein [Fusarium bulbicola]
MPELTVPGAVLHYETFGTEGPILLFIPGADGRGSVFHSVAKFLAAHFTVVCWDRRGYSESFLVGQQDFRHRLQTDADNAQRLIVHLSRSKTAIIFGTSSGAVVAQQLLASHPECVAKLIAHVYNTYRAHGPDVAMETFTSGLSKGADTKIIRHCMDAKRGSKIRANCLFWFEFELR